MSETKSKGTTGRGILGIVFMLAFFGLFVTFSVSASLSYELKGNPTGFWGAILFGVLALGVAAAIAVEANALLKEIPPDALQRLGHPVPDDAVSYRWVQEIGEAINQSGYTWPTDNPFLSIDMTLREQERSNRIQLLLAEAKRWKGKRAPAKLFVDSEKV